jgi:hypothetical protein
LELDLLCFTPTSECLKRKANLSVHARGRRKSLCTLELVKCRRVVSNPPELEASLNVSFGFILGWGLRERASRQQ